MAFGLRRAVLRGQHHEPVLLLLRGPHVDACSARVVLAEVAGCGPAVGPGPEEGEAGRGRQGFLRLAARGRGRPRPDVVEGIHLHEPRRLGDHRLGGRHPHRDQLLADTHENGAREDGTGLPEYGLRSADIPSVGVHVGLDQRQIRGLAEILRGLFRFLAERSVLRRVVHLLDLRLALRPAGHATGPGPAHPAGARPCCDGEAGRG
mmetsp:Transcript_18913/g.52758  ORF Transcript_18913/g.52758 Transcript_18913/m.52758 type:complete len:206 (+) Transcript_18913:1243-1860(+)